MSKSLFGILAFLAPIPALLAIFPSFGIASEFFISFFPQLWWGYALLGATALIWDKRALAIAAIATCILMAFYWFILLQGAINQGESSHDFKGEGLKTAHFNILFNNPDKDSLIRTAKETHADLLSFQEVTPAWESALQAHLQKDYPYHWINSRRDPFGIALFAKYPLEDVELLPIGYTKTLTAKLCHPTGTLKLISAHPTSPFSNRRLALRNQHLQALAALARKEKIPTLLIGDMNAVPWSPAIRQLMANSGLQDSRNGQLASTWPSWFPLMGAPIDYIFHSKEVHCQSFRTLRTSSDHFGIVGQYQIKPAKGFSMQASSYSRR